MRLFRPWFFAAWFLPEAIFRLKANEKNLCLTFDDGPDPRSTPFLLEILAKHNVKAIFFCSGCRASENPELVSEIKSEGHIIGNHGYSHNVGLFTSPSEYLENILSAAPLTSENLFRPPYGRITRSQYNKLFETYTIMLWDLMAYDFDKSFGKEKSLSVLKNKIRTGSIIVLHDKPDSTAPEFLEEFIVHCFSKGYRFVLPD
jgi:peptidoglycan/xylan/chitin deacetylase (PgdA/CDA1 family)